MTKSCFYASKIVQVVSAGFRALFFLCGSNAHTPQHFRRTHVVVFQGDMHFLVKN